MKQFIFYTLSVLLILPFTGLSDSSSKTRWSSTHNIPDADLLNGGKFVIDAHGFFYSDVDKGYTVKPSALITLGIIEWINLEAGYAGGGTFGLKARILGETNKIMPSVAVGIHNVFSHKEAHNYGFSSDSLSNELYIAFAKSVENIKLRLHMGVQSIPQNPHEKVNPFFAVEKYFGNGVYLSLEVQRRDEKYYASAFTTYRFLKRKMEISAGLIDIAGLFDNDDGKSSINFTSSNIERFTRPGLFFGIRFMGGLRMGRSDGFTSLEDRISHQNESYLSLKNEVDSLRNIIKSSKTKIENIDQALQEISDSSDNNYTQLKNTVSQKLIKIKTLYEEEPFEPEQVKNAILEIMGYRDRIIPVLSEIALDRKENSQIRTLAISVMGEIGSRSAADAMIEILAQAQLSEMKIECLIGLGKIKETRAKYLMQQLAQDPHDGVAFTATEVLKKLEKETGIKMTVENKIPSEQKIPEKKIGESDRFTVPVTIQTDTVSVSDTTGKINAVTSSEIEESNIDLESVKKIDSLPVPTLIQQTDSLPSNDSVTVKPTPAIKEKIPEEKPKKEGRKKEKNKVDW